MPAALIGALTLAIVYLTPKGIARVLPTPLIALVGYGGIIGTATGLWAVASAIQRLGAVTASVGLLGGPVVALTVSVIFQGEALTLTLGGGLVLILGGIALVTLAQNRAQNRAWKSS